VQGDTIRNITGGTGATTSWNQPINTSGNLGWGALFAQYEVSSGGNLTGTPFNQWRSVGFNAAFAVPTSQENRPVNMAVRYLIRAKM